MKTKWISVLVILALIAVMVALIIPVYNQNKLDNNASDSLKVVNDSLLGLNKNLLLKVDTLKVKQDSLSAVIDTVKKK